MKRKFLVPAHPGSHSCCCTAPSASLEGQRHKDSSTSSAPRQLPLPAGQSPAADTNWYSTGWCTTAFLLSPSCLQRPLVMPVTGSLSRLELIFSSCCVVSWMGGGLLPFSCCCITHFSLLFLFTLTLFCQLSDPILLLFTLLTMKQFK